MKTILSVDVTDQEEFADGHSWLDFSAADNTNITIKLQKIDDEFYALDIETCSRLDTDFSTTLSISGVTSTTIGMLIKAFEKVKKELVSEARKNNPKK